MLVMHYGSELPDDETSNLSLSHALGSEWVSERMNEHCGACKQSEQRMIERCKQTNKWKSEWLSSYLPILACSEPLCNVLGLHSLASTENEVVITLFTSLEPTFPFNPRANVSAPL